MVENDALNRVPPQNLEAEACLIGSLLQENDVIGEVVQTLKPEDFYRTAHRLIYQAIIDIYDRIQSVDLVILREELARKGLLEEAGGEEYIAELFSTVPSGANASRYASIVKEKSIRRNLIQAAAQIAREARENPAAPDELLDISEKRIFDVSQWGTTAEAISLGSILHEVMKQVDTYQHRRGLLTGIRTGFRDLDSITGGLQNGELIVLASRPSVGKTTLALNVIEHVAIKEKLPVALFSLEMSSVQIAQNMLCSHAGIDAHKLRKGLAGESEMTKINLAVGPLNEAKVYIDDTSSLNCFQLRARARRLRAVAGIRLLVVDYLQLMSAPRAENRQQEISGISRGLKALAKELAIPVIAISQLNRAPETREEHRPRMSDLRESGSIEQDADVVLLLHREDYYEARSADVEAESTQPSARKVEGHLANVIVAKQRNGPTGVITLHFDPSILRFRDFTRRKEPESVPTSVYL